jgi:hypothetical protein
MSATFPFRLLVEITFHYSFKRLGFLFQTIRGLSNLPVEKLQIVVTTNTEDVGSLENIRGLCSPLLDSSPWGGWGARNLAIESFPRLEDPWHLPWCHKHLIPDQFLADGSTYTHFIHLEDDLLLTLDNLLYFDHYLKLLYPHGLIPAFQRVEYNSKKHQLRLLDQLGVSNFDVRGKVWDGDFAFVNPDFPHMAMFILDKALALEYVASRSFDRIQSTELRPNWGLCERASMGLCFENPPEQFWSRYVVPVHAATKRTPSWSWIYHVANNYFDNPRSPHGKTPPEMQFNGDAGAVDWSPPTLAQNIKWHLRQLPDRIFRGKKNTGHDLVPPGLCGMCGKRPSESYPCDRVGCPEAVRQ